MTLIEVKDALEKIGFQKYGKSSTKEMRKGSYCFFIQPENLFLQIYQTKDGSNAKGRSFSSEIFKPLPSKACNNLKEVEDTIQGF